MMGALGRSASANAQTAGGWTIMAVRRRCRRFGIDARRSHRRTVPVCIRHNRIGRIRRRSEVGQRRCKREAQRSKRPRGVGPKEWARVAGDGSFVVELHAGDCGRRPDRVGFFAPFRDATRSSRRLASAVDRPRMHLLIAVEAAGGCACAFEAWTQKTKGMS